MCFTRFDLLPLTLVRIQLWRGFSMRCQAEAMADVAGSSHFARLGELSLSS